MMGQNRLDSYKAHQGDAGAPDPCDDLWAAAKNRHEATRQARDSPKRLCRRGERTWDPSDCCLKWTDVDVLTAPVSG